MTSKRSNKPLIFSGAAGSGKGTVIKLAMQKYPKLKLSVSMTTRKPRPGEVDGREYSFVSKEEFLKTIEEDGFLEHTEYCGNYYGTPKKQFFDMLDKGFIPVLEIETDGAGQIMAKLDDYESIFLAPPDYKTLEKRLRGRGTEAEADIEKRLAAAKNEIKISEKYRNIILNFDDMAENAADAIIEICTKGDTESIAKVKDRDEFLSRFI